MRQKKGLAMLAEEFGISRQAISKLAKRGMPTHDAVAAREWRRMELNPAKAVPDPGPSAATLVERVHRLRDLVDAAREAGRLDLVLDPMRDAMQAVPVAQRGEIRLPTWLWSTLIGKHALLVLGEGADPDRDMPPDDADELGALAFQLASGEAAAR